MDTNFYDVIVCGAELAGVVAAALLGRRGMRVLLLGHDLQRPSFDAGPITLSRGPALLPSPDSPALDRVLKELGGAEPEIVASAVPGDPVLTGAGRLAWRGVIADLARRAMAP